MSLSIGIGTTHQFIEQEMISLNLNDQRLNRRAKSILNTLSNKLGSCVRRLFTNACDARQAYDFFKNVKVSSPQLIAPHYESTVKRIHQLKAPYILAIMDQMRLNYTHHKAKSDLGMIGKVGKTDQYGIIQHNALCVTPNNEPLGLMDLQFFDYNDFDLSIPKEQRNIEEKASSMWINSVHNIRQRINAGAYAGAYAGAGESDVRIIMVADRESDFYEFTHMLTTQREEFVIRCQHNRIIGEVYTPNGEKLLDHMAKAEILGNIAVEIQEVNSREIKTIKLNLKASEINIPIPKNLKKEQIAAHNYDTVKINVVVAYNDEYSWVLLTNLAVNTLEEISEIVNIYRARWHIEDFHKVLKTGYQVDEIFLHSSSEAIKNMLVMAAISACRLYWMIYIGRSEINVKASALFEDFEWKAVYVYLTLPLPKTCPTVSEVVLKIAQLGGYKPNKKSPPGIKTMWTALN